MKPTTARISRRAQTRRALPWMWLGLSGAWLLLIVVTDQLTSFKYLVSGDGTLRG